MRSTGFTIALGILLIGCQTATQPTRIEIGGTPGAQVGGYYVRNGKRVELHAALPTTLPSHGVSQFAIWKSNPRDNLTVKVQGPDGVMSTVCHRESRWASTCRSPAG